MASLSSYELNNGLCEDSLEIFVVSYALNELNRAYKWSKQSILGFLFFFKENGLISKKSVKRFIQL